MTLLAVEGLTAGYGSRHVLFEFSLAVQQHDTVLIVGPNGSGKSTFFKTLIGSAQVYGGSASFNQMPISLPVKDKSVQSKLGFVPQQLNTFLSLTVQENLQLALSALPKYSDTNGSEFARELLAQFKIPSTLTAAQLSGGQRQCLAIALGIVRNPSLLFMDEPLAGLDPLAAEKILEAVSMLKRELNITLVIIEHRYAYLTPLAGSIIGIRDGRKRLEIFEAEERNAEQKREAIENLYFETGDECSN